MYLSYLKKIDFIPPKNYNIFAHNITERRNKKVSYIFMILGGIILIWAIYLFILVISSELLYFILKISKKLLFSQADFIGVFLISLIVEPFNLYLPLNLTSEFIGVFIFVPTIFFYNTEEKNEIMKSSIKLALLLLFLKLCLDKEIIFQQDPTSNLKTFISFLKSYFKAVMFSLFYAEILKVLSILICYLKKEETK